VIELLGSVQIIKVKFDTSKMSLNGSHDISSPEQGYVKDYSSLAAPLRVGAVRAAW
jgi:hypothetical protein